MDDRIKELTQGMETANKNLWANFGAIKELEKLKERLIKKDEQSKEPISEVR